jgi:putative DNA primase/helicase
VSTSGETLTLRDAALAWHQAGCSIIPIRTDGTKRAAFDWKQFQQTPPTREAITGWWDHRPDRGIAIICGTVSGHLEMLELEGRATTSEHLDKILTECATRNISPVFESLIYDGYCEWTPSGGLHLIYRITDHDIPGNTKVARRPATPEELAASPDEKIKVLAETRGEGGYVIVAPTHGTVHPNHGSWTVASGQIGVIPEISWQERQSLVEAIHAALDEMPAVQTTPDPPPARPHPATLLGRPGDDYASQITWEELLVPHGWRVHHRTLQETYWTRPGKPVSEGWSATTGYAADVDRLYVWSTSTIFESERPYSKFAAYTLLEHNGDFSAAARTLRSQGFGQKQDDRYVAGTLATPAAEADLVQLRVPPQTVGSQALVAAPPQTVEPWRHDWTRPRIPVNAFADVDRSNLGASDVYAETFEETFKYCAAQKTWWYWTGRVWREDERERHEAAVKELLRHAIVEARHREDQGLSKWVQTMCRAATPAMSKWARSDPRIAVSPHQFDAARHFVSVDNGVINLDDLSFQPNHDPRMLLTKEIPIKYDKDAACYRWDQFLTEALPDPAVRNYIQRAVGLTLLGDAEQRALFLLHGQSGTGKSQFIRVLELAFGDYSETASSTTFNSSSKTATLTNDLNDLKGKRFVSVSELDEGELLNEALVKRLTGGDTAKSRGLYQENRQWRVEFMLWMATNHLPRLNSDDNAIWRRVKPILFPTVAADTAGGEITNLGEKIFAEEAPGILNWILDGVRMYQEAGLGDLDQITEAVTAYRRDVDMVAQFIDAAAEDHTIITDETASIPSRQLHAMFVDWCHRNAVRYPLGERRFGARLESLGFERRKAATANMWLGIGVGHHGMIGSMNHAVLRQ